MTAPTSIQTLRDQLHAVGVQPGALVMVHVSMRAVGPVEGGAAGLIEALAQAVGPAGTVLMVLGADPDEPFDVHETEVDVEDMGVVAEVFRTTSGVEVNDHAAARYGARGPLSERLLRDLPLHDYHGSGSVLERLVAHGGQVLRLGADPDTVTLTHLAEVRARVPNKRRVRLRYARADGGEPWIESLDDTHGIADWEHGDYFPQIFLDFRAAGHAAVGPVGRCVAERFAAEPFVAFAVAWMERELGRLPAEGQR